MVEKAYLEEKIRNAKAAIDDIQNELNKLNSGFVRIVHDSQIDVDVKFAIQQLNAILINVDSKE